MSYGRKTVMSGLRKAGQFLGDIDEKYADAIYDEKDPFRSMTSAQPLRDVQGWTKIDHYEAAGGIGPRSRKDARNAMISDTAYGVANVASRYALPAGGVTLAGKGLLDIASMFGGQADQPEPNQLPLN